jgi:hypothetical protein
VKSSFESVLLCLLLAGTSGWAQNQTPAQAPGQSPAQSSPVPTGPTPPAPTPPSSNTPAAPTPPTITLSPPKEVSSTVNTGSGLSIEPMYWFTGGTPVLRAGNAWLAGAGTSPGPLADNAPNPGNLDYNDARRASYGVRLAVPVSKNATVRFSYFQTKSDGGTVAPGNLNLFTQAINGGDLLATQYNVQSYKLSYDYLTYFWKRGNSELRFKTLYELQRISVDSEADDIVVDSTGAVTAINPAIGTTSVFLPTFGLGLEHTLNAHIRWEARASAFGLVHLGDIVDAEAQIAFRVWHFEVLGGARYLHYKTNATSAQYNVGDLYGPYAGLRYYWRKR